ncbi:MAG TPA: SMC family ATPase, partial [Chloroflexia bacterium]|nr:SMC family ATPase [Chloroflexia bacterium]
MIPLRLTLKNFMSYRDACPTLDFAALHTACLSGENGAGKSALLTAMTWALWGEAPTHASDEDLITQGETDMLVDFEFALGDQHYRVLRSRTRKGKITPGKLDFQVQDPLIGWRTISGDNLRETQRLIIDRLRMDYQTFVNSAFLRQGHADEFTTKNPTERKDILARILGLDRYDLHADRAREQARARESDRRVLMVGISELDRQIAEKPRLQAQAAEVGAYLMQACEVLAAARLESERLRLQVAHGEREEKDLANVRDRAAQDEMEITKAGRIIAVLETNLTRYQETLALREAITASYARLQQLRARGGELAERAHHQAELDSEIHRLERALDATRNKLVNEISMAKRTLAEQRTAAATVGAKEAELAKLQAELDTFTAQDAAWRAAEVELDGLQQQVAGLTGANEKLKEEGDNLNAKLAMLNESVDAAATQHRHGQEPCPLCGGLLTAEALERVRASFNADIDARRRQWKINTREIEAIKKQAEVVKARAADLETKLKGQAIAQRREAALERDLAAAREAQARAANEEARLLALEVQLDGSEFGQAERAGLQAAQARRNALNYDREEHRRVDAECRELEAYEARFADLRSAEERLQSDSERLEHERENIAGHRARLAIERAEEARLAAAVAQLLEWRRLAATQESTVRSEQARF